MRVDLSVAIVAMAKSGISLHLNYLLETFADSFLKSFPNLFFGHKQVDSEENPNTTLGCSVVDFGEERLIDQELTVSIVIKFFIHIFDMNDNEYELFSSVVSTRFFISIQPGEFSWSTTLQGHILGAFFYGYVSGLLPGGPLAERFGGEWIFGIGELLMSISSILVPVVVPTTWGAEGLIMLRIICGFGAVRRSE